MYILTIVRGTYAPATSHTNPASAAAASDHTRRARSMHDTPSACCGAYNWCTGGGGDFDDCATAGSKRDFYRVRSNTGRFMFLSQLLSSSVLYAYYYCIIYYDDVVSLIVTYSSLAAAAAAGSVVILFSFRGGKSEKKKKNHNNKKNNSKKK